MVLYCFLCHNTILQACESSLLVSNQLLLYCKTCQLTTHVSFFRVERMPHRGGRVAIFTAAQETLIVDMVRENNLIRLREIRDKVSADNVNFESIDDVSLATIDRVLRRQKMRMKQVYRVPFERNSARHKDLRYEYVQVSIHPCSQYS